jgi:hypothetical protein
MQRKYLFLILVSIFLTGFTQPVCTVGDIPISERDLSQRSMVSEIYYPESRGRYVALAQLIRGYLSGQILKSLGLKVDEAALEKEARRIDLSTRDPDKLKKIKDIYGDERSAYLKTFVSVVYYQRILYSEVFLKSEEIQKDSRNRAEFFFKEAKDSPASFSRIAEKRGLKAVKFVLSEEEGIYPYGVEREERLKEKQGIGKDHWLIKAVSKLKPGDVLPEIKEWQEGYQIIRFVDREGDDFVIESVSIPKKNYSEWFWEQASKIPVKIYDKSLKDQLLKEVSWANNLDLK